MKERGKDGRKEGKEEEGKEEGKRKRREKEGKIIWKEREIWKEKS